MADPGEWKAAVAAYVLLVATIATIRALVLFHYRLVYSAIIGIRRISAMGSLVVLRGRSGIL